MDEQDFKRIITLDKKNVSSLNLRKSLISKVDAEESKAELSEGLKDRLKRNYFETVYNTLKKAFYKHLKPYRNSTDGWDKYKLNNHKNKMNRKYLPEVLLNRLYTDVSINYLEKYPFLKKFNPLYPEYPEYIKSLDHYDTFDIVSKRDGIKVKVELINIQESDLYFPKTEILYSVHSALHSIAMVLKAANNDFKDFSGIMVHEHPLTTHIGDTEYVHYMANKLNIPLVVLTRTENLSYHLQQNGVPKQGHIGRYCTRIYKVAPSKLWYSQKYYPFLERIKYEMNMAEVKSFAEDNNINIPKDVKKRGEIGEFLAKKIEEDKLIPKNTSYAQKFKIPNQSLEPDNIVQLMGLAAYQSTRRSLMNPDLKTTHYSNPSKGFNIFETLPLFNDTFEEVKELFESSDLIENPYDNEYRNLNSFYVAGTKEIRFGCLLCPYKDIHYYKFLLDNYLDRYWLVRLMITIASAKNIIRDDKEYVIFNRAATPKKHRDLEGIV